MIGIQLDLSPGEVAYFTVKGKHYALACADEEQSTQGRSLPSGTDAGGWEPPARKVREVVHYRRALEANDLKIYREGQNFCVYFRDSLVGGFQNRQAAEIYLENLKRRLKR